MRGASKTARKRGSRKSKEKRKSLLPPFAKGRKFLAFSSARALRARSEQLREHFLRRQGQGACRTNLIAPVTAYHATEGSGNHSFSVKPTSIDAVSAEFSAGIAAGAERRVDDRVPGHMLSLDAEAETGRRGI